MSRERRQFPRIPHPFDVQYRIAGSLGQTWQAVQALNLSAGGMRFRSDDQLDLNTALEIQIHLPHLREPLLLGGHVTWTQMQASGVTEHGVEFLNVTLEQQAQIDRLVQFLKRSA